MKDRHNSSRRTSLKEGSTRFGKVSIGEVPISDLDFFFFPLKLLFHSPLYTAPTPNTHTKKSISNIHKLDCKEIKIFSSKGKQHCFSQKSWKHAQQEGRRRK